MEISLKHSRLPRRCAFGVFCAISLAASGCHRTVGRAAPAAQPGGGAAAEMRYAHVREALGDAIRRSPGDPYLALEQILLDRAAQSTADSSATLAALVRRFPRFGRGYHYLALSYMNSGRDGDAVSLLQRAAALLPADSDVQYLAGLASTRAKRLGPARKYLGNALRLDPDRADIYLVLAQAYDEPGSYPLAERYLSQYMSRAKNSAPGHYLLAKLLAAQSLRERAQQEVEEALRLDPDRGQYWLLAGRIHASFGGPEQIRRALQCYDTALAKAPGDWEAHFQLGELLLQQGQAAAALPHFDAALKLTPQPGPLHYYYAQCLLRTGKRQEAADELARYRVYRSYLADYSLLSRQIDKRPRDTGVRMKLADTCLRYRQPEAAALVLEEGVQRIPSAAPAFLTRLAGVYQLMGDDAKAIEARDRAEMDRTRTANAH